MRPLDRLPEIGERIMVRLIQVPLGPFVPARVAAMQEVRSISPELFGGPDGPLLGPADHYPADDVLRGYVCDDGYAGFCLMAGPSTCRLDTVYNPNIGFP